MSVEGTDSHQVCSVLCSLLLHETPPADDPAPITLTKPYRHDRQCIPSQTTNHHTTLTSPKASHSANSSSPRSAPQDVPYTPAVCGGLAPRPMSYLSPRTGLMRTCVGRNRRRCTRVSLGSGQVDILLSTPVADAVVGPLRKLRHRTTVHPTKKSEQIMKKVTLPTIRCTPCCSAWNMAESLRHYAGSCSLAFLVTMCASVVQASRRSRTLQAKSWRVSRTSRPHSRLFNTRSILSRAGRVF